MQSRDGEEKKNKKRNAGAGGVSSSAPSPPPVKKVVVGIDPGRANILTCVKVDAPSGKILKKYRITAKRYYCDSGYTASKRAWEGLAKRSPEYKRVADEVAKTTKNSEEYQRAVFGNMDVLWKNRCSKKMKNLKFRHYCLKRKTLDGFVNKISACGVGDYTVAFGSAKFSATGEHYASPYSLLGKMIKKKVGKERFSLVDEWNTSKVCHRCLEPLQIVAYKEKDEEGTDRIRQLRGLRRCCCRSAKSTFLSDNSGCPNAGAFVDRDYNTACIIAHKYIRAAASTIVPACCMLDRGVHANQDKKNVYFFLKSNNTTKKKDNKNLYNNNNNRVVVL